MAGITLAIAVAASVLVFYLAPIYGLVIYVAALAWYPSYLTIPVGTIDFTLSRIVIFTVFAKLFLLTDLPNRFRFIWLDRIVIIYFIAQILAGATTATSLMAFFENRAGAIFDMVLPYFAVRMVVKTKKEYLTLLKSILIIAAPLAIIGFYQCMTGNNPVGFLKKYYAWGTDGGYTPVSRSGFFRADVTFPMSIMYGLFFAMFGPVCAGLFRHIRKGRPVYLVGICLMVLGVFSSMSAGPWLAVLLAVLFLALYSYRRYWKIVLAAAILMCGIAEVISNRHFYEAIDRFTFTGGTAWYRSRLIEVALYEGGMSGHWLTGFGYGVDPGWCTRIDGRDDTDMVNHYLLVLSRFGLLAFVPFLAINIMVIKELVCAYKASVLDSDKWLIWCLSAAFFGMAGAFMSVSLFGQPTTIYYMMIGFAGVMPVIIRDRPVTTAKFRIIHQRRGLVSFLASL